MYFWSVVVKKTMPYGNLNLQSTINDNMPMTFCQPSKNAKSIFFLTVHSILFGRKLPGKHIRQSLIVLLKEVNFEERSRRMERGKGWFSYIFLCSFEFLNPVKTYPHVYIL